MSQRFIPLAQWGRDRVLYNPGTDEITVIKDDVAEKPISLAKYRKSELGMQGPRYFVESVTYRRDDTVKVVVAQEVSLREVELCFDKDEFEKLGPKPDDSVVLELRQVPKRDE